MKPISETVNNRIMVRGLDLAEDMIGKLTFTEAMLLDVRGVKPEPRDTRMVDAILVALMEHGITPSTLAARLVLDGAPESLQGAVAAGLLGTGSRFLGVIDEAARLLEGIVELGSTTSLERAAAARIAAIFEREERVPGFGHNLHRGGDPRVEALIRIARVEQLAGIHVEALEIAASEVSKRADNPLIVNAAGAVAAILLDMGYTADEVRGFALVARCAGLFAHLLDERRSPIARETWQRFHSSQTA